MPKLLIIAPLYKGPELIPALIESLIAIKAELAELDAKVLLINDSPGYTPLNEELEIWAPRLAAAVRSEVLLNAENLGFIGACNRGFEIALREGADVLLLNSDCLMTPGTVRELHEVSKLDPMTAVVSPRSNNATICNSPYPERFRSLPFREALAAHQTIQPLLPRVTYVPTAVGFCLYVRNLMLREFGVFDQIYGGGYNEENDFILRCNRRGYRAVMANHAFAYHIGNVSFSRSEALPSERELKNRTILLERYPEYERSVTRYFSGVEFTAQTLTAGLIPDASGKLRLLFDCNNVGPFHNGTFELAFKIIQAFVAQYPNNFTYYLACSEEAIRFHRFDNIGGITFTDGAERQMAPFAVAIRLAQPFAMQHLVDMAELAPITCFLILDTIALDCLNLDDQGLGRIWRQMFDTTSIVGYISDYSRDQFRRRFGRAEHTIEFVALCSTDPAEYVNVRLSASTASTASSSILIVGNHYPHKHVAETLDCFRSFPQHPPIVVLGLKVPSEARVISYSAGALEQSLVDQLYDEAKVVLFPSHYEGFGFPVLHAIARRKPVIARRSPVLEEIRIHSPFAANIHMFDTTDEMVRCALNPPSWVCDESSATMQNWRHAASALHAAVKEAEEKFDIKKMYSRLQQVELCRAYSPQAEAALSVRKQLPTAPDNDAIYLIAEQISGHAKRMLKILAGSSILNSLGVMIWRTRRHGRILKTTIGRELPRFNPENFGQVEATDLGECVTKLDLIEGFLDWSYLLTLGGRLAVTVTNRRVSDQDSSAITPDNMRLWAVSAGFEVLAAKSEGDLIKLKAAKATDWSAIIRHQCSNTNFVELAFQESLGRSATGLGAEHCHIELNQGMERYYVLRHLLASEERMMYIKDIYDLDCV